jgi:hypothetical protein
MHPPPNTPAWLAALWPYLSLPFFGGMVGALIGGCIAFVIARLQLQAKEKQDAQDWFVENYIAGGSQKVIIFIDELIAFVINARSPGVYEAALLPPEIPQEAVYRVAQALDISLLPFEIQYQRARVLNRLRDYQQSHIWLLEARRQTELAEAQKEVSELRWNHSAGLLSTKLLSEKLTDCLESLADREAGLITELPDANSTELQQKVIEAREAVFPELEKLKEATEDALTATNKTGQDIEKAYASIQRIQALNEQNILLAAEPFYLKRIDVPLDELRSLRSNLSVVQEALLSVQVGRRYDYQGIRGNRSIDFYREKINNQIRVSGSTSPDSKSGDTGNSPQSEPASS